MAKKGLGRGLDVLIGSAASLEGSKLEELPVEDIIPNPRQPRMKFDEGAIEEMARSIEAFGVVQPLVVRPVGTDYELIAGERRWRAARKAGLETVPAVVRQTTETDSLEMALIENIHRTDLNGIEEANAYQQLLEDFAITHEELANRVGRSRSSITNTLRLLQLPPRIQRESMDGRISTGHARALLVLQDRPEEQDRMCSRIIAEGLSVRQVEQMVSGEAPHLEEPDRRTTDRRQAPPEMLEVVSKLSDVLDTRVKGSLSRNRGRLVIEFSDIEDLQRIFATILSGPPGEEPLPRSEDDG